MRIRLFTFGVLMLSAVCLAQPAAPPNKAPLPRDGNTVTILRQASSTTSPIMTRKFAALTDEATWKALWSKDGAPVAVDFTKEMVLLAATGQHNTGGFNIAITEVRETDQRITAFVTETSPGVDMMTIDMLTQPYTVAVITKSEKPVYFGNDTLGVTVVPVDQTFTYTSSKVTEAGQLVIKEVDPWKELYNKQLPAGTALPEVNFGSRMALVLMTGPSPTPRRLIITGVTEVNGKIVVDYISRLIPVAMIIDPTEGSRNFSPVAIVIVPKSDLEVTFRSATATRTPPLSGGVQ
jgi:hypothetical protein